MTIFGNMNVNAVKRYDWSPSRKHTQFIEDARNNKPMVNLIVPVSNYFCFANEDTFNANVVDQYLADLTDGKTKTYKENILVISFCNEPDLQGNRNMNMSKGLA